MMHLLDESYKSKAEYINKISNSLTPLDNQFMDLSLPNKGLISVPFGQCFFCDKKPIINIDISLDLSYVGYRFNFNPYFYFLGKYPSAKNFATFSSYYYPYIFFILYDFMFKDGSHYRGHYVTLGFNLDSVNFSGSSPWGSFATIQLIEPYNGSPHSFLIYNEGRSYYTQGSYLYIPNSGGEFTGGFSTGGVLSSFSKADIDYIYNLYNKIII